MDGCRRIGERIAAGLKEDIMSFNFFVKYRALDCHGGGPEGKVVLVPGSVGGERRGECQAEQFCEFK